MVPEDDVRATAGPDAPTGTLSGSASRFGRVPARLSFEAVPVTVDGHQVVAASIGRRVVAHLVDVLLVTTVQTIAFVIAFAPAVPELVEGLQRASRLTAAQDRVRAGLDVFVAAFTDRWVELLVALSVVWLVGGVYQVLFTRYRYGTIGKLVTGLATVDVHTLRRLSWKSAVVRWGGPAVVSGVSAAMVVAQLITVVGYGWAAFDGRRRAVHDLLAGSLVVERTSLPPGSPAHRSPSAAGFMSAAGVVSPADVTPTADRSG